MFNSSTIEGKDLQAKQEGDYNQPKYASTSRQWAGFKNPRIVRVSKAFGGKDRHSKVTTVKGLRDRRIRLSVPTALQLYDLQDKLGLNQPSKVIDWLLDSTKDDIDQLPPLQMLPNQFHLVPPALIPQDLNSPQVSFSQFLNSTPNATFVKDVGNRTLLYTKQGIKLNHNANSDINEDDHDHQRKKGKEAQALTIENKWKDEENGGLNFFPIPQYSYNNTGLLPYNPYYNWEPSSNLSISQFGNQDHSSIPSASQFSFSPPPPPPPPTAMITPSSLPPYLMHHDLNTTRPNSHFHLLSSSSQHAPPNSLMPLFNSGDSEEKLPFGLDAPRPKVRLPKTNHLHQR